MKKDEKSRKKVKKGIDKEEEKWYNNKAVGESNKLSRKVEKTQKKFAKTPWQTGNKVI